MMLLALMFVVSIFSITAPLEAAAATHPGIRVEFLDGGSPNFGDLRVGYRVEAFGSHATANLAGVRPLRVRVTNLSTTVPLNGVDIRFTGGHTDDFRLNTGTINLGAGATEASRSAIFEIAPVAGRAPLAANAERAATVTVSHSLLPSGQHSLISARYRVLPSFTITSAYISMPFGSTTLPANHNLIARDPALPGNPPPTVAGTWHWINPTSLPMGSGTIEVEFRPNSHNMSDRIPVRARVNVVVGAANLSHIMLPNNGSFSLSRGQTLGEMALSGGTSGGTWSWIGTGGNNLASTVPPLGTNFFSLRFVPTNQQNFNFAAGAVPNLPAGSVASVSGTGANRGVTISNIPVNVTPGNVIIRANDIVVLIGSERPTAHEGFEVIGLVGNDRLSTQPTIRLNQNVIANANMNQAGVIHNAVIVSGGALPTGAAGANYAGLVHVNGSLRIVSTLPTDTGSGTTTNLTPGWHQVDGNWVYAETGGRLATGWLNTGGAWYFMDTSGRMQTGWIADNGSWYFLRSNGAMAIGWVLDGGLWYMLGSSGAMQTGWIQDGGTWYFLESSGAMATGWVQVGGTWYYMRANGSMVTGIQTIGGVRHRFNASGAWLGRA
jgi:hypothetical protein